MLKLFETFQEKASVNQLLVQMPNTAALVFTANEKKGSYTGFFQHIDRSRCFDYKSFVAVNALPGPG